MYNFKNKEHNLLVANNYMLAKTISMFEWQNLPLTIPTVELEKRLQINGYVFITKIDNSIYAVSGGLGGEDDIYGNPTKITVTIPSINFNKTLDIVKDGVLLVNDDFKMGLKPLFNRYNTFLVENDINMMLFGYNTRSQKIISASNDKTKASAELFIKKTIDGEVGVIGENALFEGLTVHGSKTDNGASINNLIEYNQYLKGSLYNEIGLSANFNMKRERLTSGESDKGVDELYPLICNMLKCRMVGVEQINKMFNLNINVDFGSVWAKNAKELLDDKVEENGKKETDIENSNSSSKNSGGGNSEEQKNELKNDLLAIMKDINASSEDKKTAQELLKELNNE